MGTVYVVATVVVAAANVWAASNDFRRLPWIIDGMNRLGVPMSQLMPLGALKVAGAVGLLVGLAVPALGIAAAAGLVLFFVGAIVTVVRARWWEHLPFPATFLALATAALVLRIATF